MITRIKYRLKKHKRYLKTKKHCYRESDTVIRLILARKATTTETRQYNEFLQQKGVIMREEYDFSNARKNPYVKKAKND